MQRKKKTVMKPKHASFLFLRMLFKNIKKFMTVLLNFWCSLIHSMSKCALKTTDTEVINNRYHDILDQHDLNYRFYFGGA